MTDTKTRYLDVMKNRFQITGSDQPSVGKINAGPTITLDIDVVNDVATLDVNIDAVLSQSGGASVSASFITVSAESGLTNERRLTAGTGISLTDNGAGSTLVVAATDSAAAKADISASYVVIALTSSLPNERALTSLNGISMFDNGAGGTVGFQLDQAYTRDVLLQTFAPASASYLVLNTTGTLANERQLAQGQDITFTDAGAGSSLTVSTNRTTLRQQFADVTASYLVLAATTSLPNERVLTTHDGILAIDGGAGNSLRLSTPFVSATFITTVATGTLPNAVPLVAGPNVTINFANNKAEITASAGTGSGDPDATYIVLSATSSLNNERRLVTGSLLTKTDGGAGGDLVINANLPAITASLDATNKYAYGLQSYITTQAASNPNDRQAFAGTYTTLDTSTPNTILIDANVAAISAAICPQQPFNYGPPHYGTVRTTTAVAKDRVDATYFGYFPAGHVFQNAAFHLVITASGLGGISGSGAYEIGLASSSQEPATAGIPNSLVVITSSMVDVTAAIPSSVALYRSGTTNWNYTLPVAQHIWVIGVSHYDVGPTIKMIDTGTAGQFYPTGIRKFKDSVTTHLSNSKNSSLASAWSDNAGNNFGILSVLKKT